ncbi:MAG: AI-2E family transporter [Acidobacteriales bacterium]|nr:AI-2E family transporter [Terriglobales bacterium]
MALTSLIFLLYFGRDFFITIIISAVFAFILDPAVVVIVRFCVPRGAATGIVIGIAIVVAYLLGAMAWSQIATISEDLPSYSARVGEVATTINTKIDQLEQRTLDMVVPKTFRPQASAPDQKPQDTRNRRRRLTPAVSAANPALSPPIQEVRIHTDPRPVIGTIYGYVSGYMHVLVMASFVPFLVYFMLSWRDHIARGFLQLFQGEARYVVDKSWSHIGEATRAFVLGNFLLWVFLGSLSAVLFFFLGLPYWPLVGLLSAFLSLVPYAGLPLSLVPPILAAIDTPDNLKIVISVIVATAALHLISMNFLYPKIIGKRVRLNPLVVTVAMMFWGLLWGAIGLVLAIPITAAIKAVCDNVESLEGYGKLLGDN